jgi:hypothetical protein
MPLADGRRLGPYEIVAPSVREGWASLSLEGHPAGARRGDQGPRRGDRARRRRPADLAVAVSFLDGGSHRRVGFGRPFGMREGSTCPSPSERQLATPSIGVRPHRPASLTSVRAARRHRGTWGSVRGMSGGSAPSRLPKGGAMGESSRAQPSSRRMVWALATVGALVLAISAAPAQRPGIAETFSEPVVSGIDVEGYVAAHEKLRAELLAEMPDGTLDRILDVKVTADDLQGLERADAEDPGRTVVGMARKVGPLPKLAQNPPSSSVLSGWTTGNIANANGTALFRISHPATAPQAYSTQTVDTSAPTCGGWPRVERIYSRDTYGATEGAAAAPPSSTAPAKWSDSSAGRAATTRATRATASRTRPSTAPSPAATARSQATSTRPSASRTPRSATTGPTTTATTPIAAMIRPVPEASAWIGGRPAAPTPSAARASAGDVGAARAAGSPGATVGRVHAGPRAGGKGHPPFSCPFPPTSVARPMPGARGRP